MLQIIFYLLARLEILSFDFISNKMRGWYQKREQTLLIDIHRDITPQLGA
jgi:hypothetical protein